MRVSRTSLWQPSLEAGLPTSRPWGLQTALFSTGAQFQCGQCGTSAVGEQSFVCMRRGDMAMDMAAGEARVTPKFLNTINSSVGTTFGKLFNNLLFNDSNTRSAVVR